MQVFVKTGNVCKLKVIIRRQDVTVTEFRRHCTVVGVPFRSA